MTSFVTPGTPPGHPPGTPPPGGGAGPPICHFPNIGVVNFSGGVTLHFCVRSTGLTTLFVTKVSGESLFQTFRGSSPVA